MQMVPKKLCIYRAQMRALFPTSSLCPLSPSLLLGGHWGSCTQTQCSPWEKEEAHQTGVQKGSQPEMPFWLSWCGDAALCCHHVVLQYCYKSSPPPPPAPSPLHPLPHPCEKACLQTRTLGSGFPDQKRLFFFFEVYLLVKVFSAGRRYFCVITGCIQHLGSAYSVWEASLPSGFSLF